MCQRTLVAVGVGLTAARDGGVAAGVAFPRIPGAIAGYPVHRVGIAATLLNGAACRTQDKDPPGLC
jgi:hypothetical protein